MLERQIQSVFKAYLIYVGFFVIRHNVVSFHKGEIIASAKDQLGMPDLIACYDGRFFGFEIKTLKGKQSPYQKLREQEIKKAGGEYFLVHSLEEGKAIVAEIKGQINIGLRFA